MLLLRLLKIWAAQALQNIPSIGGGVGIATIMAIVQTRVHRYPQLTIAAHIIAYGVGFSVILQGLHWIGADAPLDTTSTRTALVVTVASLVITILDYANVIMGG